MAPKAEKLPDGEWEWFKGLLDNARAKLSDAMDLVVEDMHDDLKEPRPETIAAMREALDAAEGR